MKSADAAHLRFSAFPTAWNHFFNAARSVESQVILWPYDAGETPALPGSPVRAYRNAITLRPFPSTLLLLPSTFYLLPFTFCLSPVKHSLQTINL